METFSKKGYKKLVIEHIRDLASGDVEPRSNRVESCDELAHYFGYAWSDEALRDLARWWPKSLKLAPSMVDWFWVPGSFKDAEGAVPFGAALDLYGEHEQGFNRREWLDFLADLLETVED